jgi:hypothetical protein
MDIRWRDRFTVLLGFICLPQMIFAETHTCILSVIQCSTVQSLLLKCNFSSSLQSVFVSSLISQECKQVEKDSPYYDFHYNTRRARPSIIHFQVWFSSVALQSNFLSKVIIKHVVYGFVWFEEWFVLGRLVHHEAILFVWPFLQWFLAVILEDIDVEENYSLVSISWISKTAFTKLVFTQFANLTLILGE